MNEPIMNSSQGDQPDPDSIKMFVGQVPRSYDESDLKKLFEEFGAVYQINVLRDKVTNQSRGCCFVTFYTRKAALDAQNALHNIKTLQGMHHPIQMKPADSENRNERKLFVGMLSKKCNENEVKVLFSPFGAIEECTVLKDANNQSKGCAFVTFASRQCAINAIKSMNHSQTMEGCSSPLVVKFADTQKEKDQKRQQQMMANLWNMATFANVGAAATLANPYLTNPQQNPFAAAFNPNLSQVAGANQRLGALNMPQIAALAAAQATSGNTGQGLMAGLNSLNLQGLANQGALALATSGSNNTALGYNIDLSNTNIQGLAALASLANNPGLNPVIVQNLAALTAAANTNNTSSLGASLSAAAGSQPGGGGLNAISPNLGLNSLSNLSGVNGMGNNSSQMANNGPNLEVLSQAYSGIQQFSGLNSGRFNQVHQHQPQQQQQQSQSTAGPEGANLFIYHLPQEFTDTDLAQTFIPFGTVVSAKVFVDKQTNLSKCFGFVSYDNPLSAQAAIQAMNGFQIGMKRLKVQLKRSKDASKPY